MPGTHIAILSAPYTTKASSTDPINGFLDENITTSSGVVVEVVDDGYDKKLLITLNGDGVLAANHASTHETGGDDVLSGDIPLSRITGSTYYNIQHMQDVFHSAGLVTGGAMSDAGGFTVDVGAGTGFIRAINSSTAELKFFDWPATNGTAVPSDTTYLVGVEYNSGSPQITFRTEKDWNYNTDFPIGRVTNDGTHLHVEYSPLQVGDHASLMARRAHETMPLARDERHGGLLLGESGDGNRYVTMSSGVLWDRLNRNQIAAINTSGSDRFESYYRDGVGGDWTETENVQVWQNSHYDLNGVLTAMGANKYSSNWFYLQFDGELLMVYPQTQHNTAAQALSQAPPGVLPSHISEHAKLIGRIVFQQGQTTAYTVQSVFGSTFSLSSTLALHAATHQSGGSDAIKLDNLAAPDDNTDLNASTSAHGLLPKLDNDSTHYLDGTGSWTEPSGVVPAAHATSHKSGGSDSIKLDELAAPDDNTTLDATSSAHGLLPKLTDDNTDCLRGDGTWVGVPPWINYPNDVEEADAIDIVSPVGTAALDPDKGVFRLWWEDSVGAETEIFNVKERELNLLTAGRAEILGDEEDGASAVGTVVGTSVEFTVDGAELLKVQNAGIDKETTNYKGGKRFCISDTGGYLGFDYEEELLTIDDAATTDSYIEIPAGSQAIVTCRVITAIPTATTFNIGDSVSTTRWGNALSVNVGTTNEYVAQTNGFVFFGAATKIRITPSSTPATATGQVRLYVVYMKVGAPTS